MGAWGEKPLQDDTALDWIGECVNSHLIQVIESTLEHYLLDCLDGAESVAEAAAALLVDCTSFPTALKYHSIDLRYEANKRGLWDLAIQLVDKLMSSTDWIDSWKSPDEKLDALKELKQNLEQVKNAYQEIGK